MYKNKFLFKSSTAQSDEGTMDGQEEQQKIPSYGCPMLKQLCAQNICNFHDSLMLQVFRNLFNGASLHAIFCTFFI